MTDAVHDDVAEKIRANKREHIANKRKDFEYREKEKENQKAYKREQRKITAKKDKSRLDNRLALQKILSFTLTNDVLEVTAIVEGNKLIIWLLFECWALYLCRYLT